MSSKRTVRVSLDNGNSRTILTTEAEAAEFARRYGEQNLIAWLRQNGDWTDHDGYQDLLAAASAFLPAGEVLTLP